MDTEFRPGTERRSRNVRSCPDICLRVGDNRPRRYTQARQLIGGDASVSGHDEFVAAVLVRCIHSVKCSPTTYRRSRGAASVAPEPNAAFLTRR